MLKKYKFTLAHMPHDEWRAEYGSLLVADRGGDLPFERDLIVTEGPFTGERATGMLEMAGLWWEARLATLDFKLWRRLAENALRNGKTVACQAERPH
jgi:hypothetical protein